MFLKGGIRLTILLLFVLNITVRAQPAGSEYRFIDQAANRIFFSSDSSGFLRLFKKMDKMASEKKERITVVHIGGSHVQGGTWSNTFITALQEKHVTAGGGYFVFPYRIGKTNGQPYASSFTDGRWKLCRAVRKQFCLPLGMSALSVATNDSSNYFGAALTKKAACKFVNSVKVYHNFNKSFSFRLSVADSQYVSRIDLPEEGYSLFTSTMPVDSVCFRLTKVDTLTPDFVLFGFSFENYLAPGFYLAGLGANGASSGSFLLSNDLVSQLRSLNGDLFILSLGVNDTQSRGFNKDDFIINYDSLIAAIRQASPRAAILITTTTDNFIKRKTANKRTIAAKDAMFQLMDSSNVAVWDLFTVMGGWKSMTKWFNAGLASKDKVHFNNKGYTIVGNLMYEAFMRSYEQYRNK